jgi:hypothetical protein
MVDTIDTELAYDEQQVAFDANDPSAIEAAEKNNARIKAKKLRVVEAIMSSEDGRAWMFDLLGTNCHVFADNPMRDTPERNGRYEGERAVGLRLLDEIMTAAPEQFWLMRMEHLERNRNATSRS